MISRERVGTEIGLMTGRLKQSLRNGKDNLSSIRSTWSDKTRRTARRTNYYVHDNAWIMMGVTAGAAFAAGFLLSRASQRGMAKAAGDLPTAERVKTLNAREFLYSSLPLALFLWKAVQGSRCARKGLI